MTTFDDREKAFENRFVHDQELAFKAEARRDREVAHWAGGLLGKTGADLDVYLDEVIAAALQGGGEAVEQKLVADLASASPPLLAPDVRARMDLELAKAVKELMTE